MVDDEQVTVRRTEDLDPCGECPRGECDGCEGCTWIVAMLEAEE